MITQWTLTDGSTLQFRKNYLASENNGKFLFREFDNREYDLEAATALWYNNRQEFINQYWNVDKYWIEAEVDLSAYTKEKAWDYVSGYYDINEFNDMWGSKFDHDIIAECIFEQTNGLY